MLVSARKDLIEHARKLATQALFRDGLCLPSGTALTDADLDRVVEVIRGMRR